MQLIAAKNESLMRHLPVGLMEKDTGDLRRLFYLSVNPDQAFTLNA
jgi:hypothetical protein